MPGTLSVMVTDSNVGDFLYVHWLGEYPPYQPQISRLLKNDTVYPSVDGTATFGVVTFPDLSCGSLVTGMPQHNVTALFTDRPFPDASTLKGEDLLNKTAPGAGRAEAHWVISVNCQ